MNVYRSRANQPLKWIVALCVFVLAMSLTFSDVYGFSRDNSNNTPGGKHHDRNRPGGGGNHDGGNGGNGCNDNPTPTAVPEPGTLVLLAGGLSALYVARRVKKDK